MFILSSLKREVERVMKYVLVAIITLRFGWDTTKEMHQIKSEHTRGKR